MSAEPRDAIRASLRSSAALIGLGIANHIVLARRPRVTVSLYALSLGALAGDRSAC